MPIKLIQASKDLSVGISTAVEYLQKSGHAIDNNPNVRISDDQFALLIKEFGKDLSPNERERLLAKPPVIPPVIVVPERKQEKKEEKPKSEIRTEIPEELRLKLVTKGKIELEKPKRTEKSLDEDEQPAPERQVAVKENIQPKPVEKPVEIPSTKEAVLPPEEKEITMEEKKVPQVAVRSLYLFYRII
ncbi:hypothetical protein FACS189431_7860 [Alphaproteobacteria bacterium]|nr:hypothetical protein FACS189431_7860 [Alphaproteobacteria bacterium]